MGKYLDFDVNINIRKNKSNLEGPYQFILTFNDDLGNVFELPQITFSVVEDMAYLMCVQNKNNQDNKLISKLDRYFRKVNKGVDPKSDICQVSPRFLVSFIVFNQYLKSMGVEKLEVNSYFPLRYQTKVSKAKRQKLDMEDEMIDIDRDQYNMTNRLMYLIKRYAYHFEESICDFNDITLRMNLKIKNKTVKNDSIVYELNALAKQVKNGKKIR